MLGIGQEFTTDNRKASTDSTIENYGTSMCILMANFCSFRSLTGWIQLYRLLKLTDETNLTSLFNNRFITDQCVGLGMESKALVH